MCVVYLVAKHVPGMSYQMVDELVVHIDSTNYIPLLLSVGTGVKTLFFK